MKVYCVSYDLKGVKRDYTPLFSPLQGMGKWRHFLESTWLIATDETPAEIWRRIATMIDANDRLLIIEVRDDRNGWLPKDAWDWIISNVPPP
jgi:hypothetical protein